MDKQNENQSGVNDEKWLDDVLGEAAAPQELGMDESAVKSAGLRHPDQLDLESILAENWDETVPPESMEDLPPESSGELPGEDAPADSEGYFPDAAPEAAYGQDVLPPEQSDWDTGDNGTGSTDSGDEKKRRPKRKKGYGLLGIPHILSTAIWLFLILAIGVSLGRTIWVCCADVMAFGKEDQQVTVTITDADNIDTISEKLGKANLVRYPGLFKTFAQITKKADRISVGTFTLNSRLDYNAMINAMGAHGSAREEVNVLFPEGYNCAQIFRLLEENNVCTVQELEQWAAEGELDDYWFLDGVQRGSKYCLEGYLAPDTYTFYTNDDPKRVLEKFLDEFDDRFTDIMRDNFETMKERYASMLASHGYDEAYIQDHPLTLHQVVTLASIVQKEMSTEEESYDIASVFYNRITDLSNYPFLDSDATVYYAIGDYFGETGELTASQLETDSPYNTRRSQGLPPGPICNPGSFALYAALAPSETNYHYFVYDKDERKHRFSDTYEEHQRIVEELGL